MSSIDEDLKATIVKRLASFDVRGEKQFHQTYPKPFKTAAVLLPLKICDGEIFILLTKRAKSLRSHASDAAFPGGMKEESDPSVIATALREANEEIGLPPESVEILAVLNRGMTMPGTVVYPVVELIPKDFQPRVNPSEVEFAFFILLQDFLCEDKLVVSHAKLDFITLISRQLFYKERGREAKVWGFTSSYCILLAKIVFGHNDILEFFVGSVNIDIMRKISDPFEEYFNLFCSWVLSKYSSKL